MWPRPLTLCFKSLSLTVLYIIRTSTAFEARIRRFVRKSGRGLVWSFCDDSFDSWPLTLDVLPQYTRRGSSFRHLPVSDMMYPMPMPSLNGVVSYKQAQQFLSDNNSAFSFFDETRPRQWICCCPKWHCLILIGSEDWWDSSINIRRITGSGCMAVSALCRSFADLDECWNQPVDQPMPVYFLRRP